MGSPIPQAALALPEDLKQILGGPLPHRFRAVAHPGGPRREPMIPLTRRSLLWGAAAAGRASASRGEKHLLLDPRIIERAEGVQLSPGKVQKDTRNPLFREDRPWEARFDNLYANVLFEERDKRFKCWYSPFIIDEAVSATPREQRAAIPYKPRNREMGVCYAESKDGLVWTKPRLGLVEFSGSTSNNLVMRGPHGAGLWKDPREADPARRYKMFFRGNHSMAASFSPDGLHWSPPVELPEIQAVGDTHNNAFWAPELNRYVGITRLWDRARRQRLVGRTESPDFSKWTKAAEVLRALPEETHRQTYAMLGFRYANVYLGLLMMFNTDTDTVDCELAWSADTMRWERVCPGEALIPRGPEGSYDSGCIYAAAYPLVYKGEIRLYYGGSNGKHTGWRDGFFCLARLRPDGFAGMEPARGFQAGALLTKPLRCSGAQLRITADAAPGSVRVSVFQADGYSSRPITGEVTDELVRWPDGKNFAALRGQAIQLLFELRSAKLYSFTFTG